MGYSLSFDASAKCGKGDVKGWLYHVERDVIDREHPGHQTRHSNPDIDATRTQDNQTLYYDQAEGKFKACKDLGQVEQSIADRLSQVKKPLRKDAVVLRGLVLQLDPQWYDAHQSDKERKQAAGDMLEWAKNTFGEQNLVTVSRHKDETHEHLHLGFIPVTEDGRLSQKDWFSSPQKLREMHNSFRAFMSDRGYDIDMERKKPGKHAKRLKEDEYKDFQELERQKQELERREKALKERETETAKKSLQNKMDAKRLTEALEQAQTLLGDIHDQKAREALESRLRVIQRPLPSAPIYSPTNQAPERTLGN